MSARRLDANRADPSIPVHRYHRAVLNSPRGVLDSDDAGEPEFARDDGAMREHPAALDHQARDQAEHGGPSWIGLAGHEDIATIEPTRLTDIGQDARGRRDRPATRTRADHRCAVWHRRFEVRCDPVLERE